MSLNVIYIWQQVIQQDRKQQVIQQDRKQQVMQQDRKTTSSGIAEFV